MNVSVSDAASVASLALSLIAIALSIVLPLVLYRWSSEKSASIDRAVQRLDDLVGRLYSDLFGEYRTTMSDLRKQFFDRMPVAASEDPEIAARADAKVAELETKLETRLTDLLKQQTDTSRAVSDAMGLVREALSESRRVDEEAREESIAQAIMRALTERGPMKLGRLMELVDAASGGSLSYTAWVEALQQLKASGSIALHPENAEPTDWDATATPRRA